MYSWIDLLGRYHFHVEIIMPIWISKIDAKQKTVSKFNTSIMNIILCDKHS